MKSVRRNRRGRVASSFALVPLEPRCLLSATLLSPISSQTVSIGTTTLSVGSHFDDSALPSGDTVVDIETSLQTGGSFDIPLYLTNAATPKTVANFLAYINNAEYNDTIIHRSTLASDGPTFSIIQGGGFLTNGTAITPMAAIPSEASTSILKNTTVGTIAMALDGATTSAASAASATTNWFINLSSNGFLDGVSGSGSSIQGPFTAFGSVIYNGLTTANNIANLPSVDDTDNGAWTNLPVQNYSGSSGDQVSNVPSDDFVETQSVIYPDQVKFSVASSNTGVVTGAITASGALTLTGVASGSANITVTATDFGGGTATSTFSVNVPTQSNKLAFTLEPVNTTVGTAVAPFKVAVETSGGAVNSADNSTITLSLGTGPTGGALGGTLTATAVSGVATFSNVTFNKVGAFTLTAKDGANTAATSTTLYVVPAVGSVDTASMNEITGWAADPNNPTASIKVEFDVTGGISQTVTANETRPDLTAVIGSSNHEFVYTTPFLSVGVHTISVYAIEVSGTRVLIGSKTVTSQNSLFDEHYYLAQNPDVAAAVAKGIFATGYDHYIAFGQFEGRSPSPYWNESWYLHSNPDVAAAITGKTITSGFMHYYLYGQYENRPGVLYFNTTYYLATYADVAPAIKSGAITSAYEHYVLYGEYGGRSPMLYFSPSYYDAKNSDILPYVTGEPFTSDFEHFIEYGQLEGRVASTLYNEQTYLADNADVAAAVKDGVFADGFIHWLEYGQYENRTA